MSDNQPQENQYEQYLSAEARSVAKLTLAFAKAVGARQSDKNDNLVVSPYNALSCLSMVAKGASAEPPEEGEHALLNWSSLLAQVFGFTPDEGRADTCALGNRPASEVSELWGLLLPPRACPALALAHLFVWEGEHVHLFLHVLPVTNAFDAGAVEVDVVLGDVVHAGGGLLEGV
jgi:hypothetical protein